jgi:hypothetical protein
LRLDSVDLGLGLALVEDDDRRSSPAALHVPLWGAAAAAVFVGFRVVATTLALSRVTAAED